VIGRFPAFTIFIPLLRAARSRLFGFSARPGN
jgi:hypothetical protein